MLCCWSNLGVERPTFQELYLTFDNMLGETTQHQSPYVQVLGNCYYDKLGPRVQVDSTDTLDLENVPANVDVRPPANGATTDGLFVGSLPENANGFLSVPQPQGIPAATAGRSLSPSQNHRGAPSSARDQSRGLPMPLHLPRPRSWVGTSTAELGPRYVPAPLFYGSPHSSTSNLTQETVFASSIVTLSPERRQLSALQSRSVGSLPLLTNPPNIHSSNTTATTRL